MNIQRLLRQSIILVFLFITCCAFLLTMLRIDVPFLRPLILYSYSMMAPYQGYERTNMELFAEGERSDGTWESIDLNPYYPVLRGEKVAREYFLLYSHHDPAAVSAAATQAAQALLRLERSKGRLYKAVRLSWQQWLPSPAGFAARRATTLESRPLTTVYD